MSAKKSSILVSQGAGMTAGLELHRLGTKFILVDKTVEGRFAADVKEWTSGLNATRPKKAKDATK